MFSKRAWDVAAVQQNGVAIEKIFRESILLSAVMTEEDWLKKIRSLGFDDKETQNALVSCI